MRFSRSFTTASVLVSLLTNCQESTKASAPTPDPSQNYIKVTFDGKTKVYTDVSLEDEGSLGSVVGWGMTAGSSTNDYLTISLFGAKAGTYPFRKDIDNYTQVSQVEYKTRNTIFNNYKALICPTTSGYYSADGQVVVIYYNAGKLAKGTFSGTLLDQNEADECSKVGKPFSGEFFLTKK